MIKTVNVGISDMKIVKDSDVVATYALGSCVGICVIDRIKKIAGLVHVMLPTNNKLGDPKQVYKYADTGIEAMIKEMEKMGCVRIRMTAKIAGGAKMFEMNDSKSTLGNIGDRNVDAVKKALAELKIRIVAEDTGLNYGRTIFFNSENGDLTVKSYAKGTTVI